MLNRPRHKLMRLAGHDYSAPGAYFLTMCTQHRTSLFGEIDGGCMKPNVAGLMVESWWGELANKFPDILLDEFVVMPNHVHGIVFLGGYVRDSGLMTSQQSGHAGPQLQERTRQDVPPNSVAADLRVRPYPPNTPSNPKLGDLVRWFKTMTTNDYIRGVRSHDFPKFNGKLWQRDYHDHIVRVDAALQRIRTYIANNPAQWGEDKENPAFAKGHGNR